MCENWAEKVLDLTFVVYFFNQQWPITFVHTGLNTLSELNGQFNNNDYVFQLSIPSALIFTVNVNILMNSAITDCL